MPIAAADIKYYQSAVYADGASNGGKLSPNLIATGTPNDIFPAVSSAERTAGVSRWRKVFIKNENAGNLTAYNPIFGISKFTSGGDQVYFTPGTQTDTEGQLPASPRLYGCGYLAANVTANSASYQVVVEDGAVPIFQQGDHVLFHDTSTGYFWTTTIKSAPTVNGNTWTINDAPPSAFTGGLDANGNPVTYVASVWAPANTTIAPALVNPAVNSTAGTFNQAQVTLENIGTVYEDWTLTFTSATAFTVTGAALGQVGTGDTTNGATIANPDFTGSNYLSIAAAAFGGTFAAGDTITFRTTPAALPVWLKQVVPANTPAATSNWQTYVQLDTP